MPFVDLEISRLSWNSVPSNPTSRKDLFRGKGHIKMRQAVSSNGQRGDDSFHLFVRFLQHEDG